MNEQYVNQVQIIGRVGQIPETKYFESGAVKSAITIAVKAPYKSDNPLWFDAECWGSIAEVCAEYVKKGSTIGINGELVLEQWNDKNTGEERYKPLIRVSNLELINSPRNNSSSEEQAEYNSEHNQVVNANF